MSIGTVCIAFVIGVVTGAIIGITYCNVIDKVAERNCGGNAK